LDLNKGIFVTTSAFDEKALQKARDASQKIIAIDGDALVDLMYQHGIGVQVRDTYHIKQVDEDFFEEE
jgi:restriction system protein